MIVSSASINEFFKGEDKQFFVTVYKKGGVIPEDITGWSFSYVWQHSIRDTTVIFQKTSADDIFIIGSYNVDPALNTQKVQIDMFDEDTDALSPGTFQHELKRTDVDHKTIIFQGVVPLMAARHQT